ncbi:CD209 antigen-like protein A [Gigantopelta aegis]|uniref:CD209 antigen-like protein A n=1 Tax=Gigantopelta aegis TaxID=1735272 RepID=UPI001B88770D|nr:CD209 antigen-like protein A [Gigantopelta aegis]
MGPTPIQRLNTKCSRAIQSSTWKQIYTADRAVDGNTGKRFFGNTCSHTDCKDDNPSWTLCLGNMQTVSSVTIHNPDKAKGRLKNIRIDVYTENPSNPGAVPISCATIGSMPVADGISITLDCPLNVVGSYIKISKTTMGRGWGRGYYMCDALVLCEVVVNATAASVTCPNGFQAFGGSCYSVPVSQTASWFEARVACSTIGAELAVIESMAENDFIKTTFFVAGNFYWTGLQKLADGMTWLWIDPNAVQGVPNGPSNVATPFEDWDVGQGGIPNIFNCMNIDNVGNGPMWFQDDCLHFHHFVCEKSPTFPAPTPIMCFQ